MTNTLDSLHPDRLRCDQCGQLLGPVDLAGEDAEALVSLSEDQVVHRWPQPSACPSTIVLPSPGPRWGTCSAGQRRGDEEVHQFGCLSSRFRTPPNSKRAASPPASAFWTAARYCFRFRANSTASARRWRATLSPCSLAEPPAPYHLRTMSRMRMASRSATAAAAVRA
jgi:hypothetical protein